MERDALSVLTAWGSFYVIVGSAAAALTGLQFVVVVLSTDMNKRSADGNRAFGTPTIVHFCAVLLIAAVVNAPWAALWGVAFIFGLCGIVGLVYGALIVRIVLLRQTDYVPVLEDWICHFTLPPIAYGALLVAAITIQSWPTLSLFVIGGVTLLLLFVGIHNAWDSVTFIALNLPQQGEGED